jgi:hypothetical protein
MVLDIDFPIVYIKNVRKRHLNNGGFMRYLFLVMAAVLMVGCGKNPAAVIEKHYYFSGETLIKVNCKDLATDSVVFDNSRNNLTVQYHLPMPMPNDLDLTYAISIPSQGISAYEPRASFLAGGPFFFIANMDSTFKFTGCTKFTPDNKYIMCIMFIPSICDEAKWKTDSVQIMQKITDIMDKSWFTYSIQKSVDLDCL